MIVYYWRSIRGGARVLFIFLVRETIFIRFCCFRCRRYFVGLVDHPILTSDLIFSRNLLAAQCPVAVYRMERKTKKETVPPENRPRGIVKRTSNEPTNRKREKKNEKELRVWPRATPHPHARIPTDPTQTISTSAHSHRIRMSMCAWVFLFFMRSIAVASYKFSISFKFRWNIDCFKSCYPVNFEMCILVGRSCHCFAYNHPASPVTATHADAHNVSTKNAKDLPPTPKPEITACATLVNARAAPTWFDMHTHTLSLLFYGSHVINSNIVTWHKPISYLFHCVCVCGVEVLHSPHVLSIRALLVRLFRFQRHCAGCNVQTDWEGQEGGVVDSLYRNAKDIHYEAQMEQ